MSYTVNCRLQAYNQGAFKWGWGLTRGSLQYSSLYRNWSVALGRYIQFLKQVKRLNITVCRVLSKKMEYVKFKYSVQIPESIPFYDYDS